MDDILQNVRQVWLSFWYKVPDGEWEQKTIQVEDKDILTNEVVSQLMLKAIKTEVEIR